ncbi:MAG: glutathione peroxidase [Chitinophagaceae bacterium]
MMMTTKQKILKWIYPVLMKFSKNAGAGNGIISNDSMKHPLASVYDISFEANDGSRISLEDYKGKKILIVNTASDCGFTPQYESLENFYKEHSDKMVIIGFPANDFKQQEKKSDEEIASFCKINYGVTFPLSKKTTVVKGAGQHELYQWLTKTEKNGWNNKQPVWNFSKYVIDENGVLLSYMPPSVDPGGEVFKKNLGFGS